MVKFAPENAPALKLPLSWLWDAKSCIVKGKLGTVSAKRIFTCLLMHHHNCIATWLKIFNRTGTTESMGDFFLLNLRKTPEVRANAALILLSRNMHYRRASKLHSSKSDTIVALIQWLVCFWESFSSLKIEVMKVLSVFFPRDAVQYQTS